MEVTQNTDGSITTVWKSKKEHDDFFVKFKEFQEKEILNPPIHTVSKESLLNPRDLKKKKKYRRFVLDIDLVIGNNVYASLWAGKRIGKLTEIIDKTYCKIEDKLTYISDIHYIILN